MSQTTIKSNRDKTEQRRATAWETLIEQIRSRAFEIVQRRAGGDGSAMADWLEAEFDLVCRRASELSELSEIEPEHPIPQRRVWKTQAWRVSPASKATRYQAHVLGYASGRGTD
jgi:hypothetical protein